jgi:hypothetical protein
MTDGWFSASGGLFYHFKALRFRKTLWLPFREELEKFLLEALTSIPSSHRENLILVGGSGGHCLPDSFLSAFQNIHHIDTDPNARLFFRWRHPGLPVRFYREDVFDLKTPLPENAVWLWAGLLGQLGLSFSEEEVEKKRKQVAFMMREKTWLSFHDLYSFRAEVERERLPLKDVYPDWKSVEPDLKKFYQFKLELRDHLTANAWEFSKSRILLWPLTSREMHFVEMGARFF